MTSYRDRLRRTAAATLVFLISFTVQPAAAYAGPAVFPAPATGLLWINVNTGELSQWRTHGSSLTGPNGAVSGPEKWAMKCDYTAGCWPHDYFAGAEDLNSDGRYDLITNDRRLYGPGQIMLHPDAKGGGTTHQPMPGSCSVYSGCDYRPVGVADFNGDGFKDLAWYEDRDFSVAPDGGRVKISLLNGQGGQVGTQFVDWRCNDACYAEWRLAGVGDVNRDGSPDLMWWQVTGPGILSAWLLDGAGHVVAIQTLNWTCGSDCLNTSWNPVGLGDFDGDGNQDLWWHNWNRGDVSIWGLNGAGTVVYEQTLDWRCDFGCSQQWNIAGIVDPNRRVALR